MPEIATSPNATIPENLLRGRLEQSEQLREFFIQMWLQNPSLAERAGQRVRDILAAARRPASADFPEFGD